MLKAKKSLSQNFLIDKNISKKILSYTNIYNKIVLEIGPGYGFMTDNIIENKEFRLFGNKIQPIQVMHYKLPVFGYKISDLVYITDANYISEIEQEKIKGIKTLIINCLQIEQHISHFNLKECLDLISFVKPQKAYLTHISHNLGLHNVIQAKLPKNVFLAYDGLKINF